ncbi:hypothetical protein TNCV_1930551 [Trichonephila clavipes]|nr:hypothetical protein TNCV_1930551 [Trichonephila clavipes]
MLDHLEDNIRRVIADIRPQMLENVIENWTSRFDFIRDSRGSHKPEIILKMKVSVSGSHYGVIKVRLAKCLSEALGESKSFRQRGLIHPQEKGVPGKPNIQVQSIYGGARCCCHGYGIERRTMHAIRTLKTNLRSTEKSLNDIRSQVKSAHQSNSAITDIDVTFDGTWLTRGHSS